jgi:hypothetical protein
MVKVAGIFAIAMALVAVFCVVWFDESSVEKRENSVRHEQTMQGIEAETARDQAERDRQRAAIMEPVTIAAQVIVNVVLVVSLIGLVAIVGHAYWRRREPLIKADERGLFPASRAQVESGALLPLVEQVAIRNKEVEGLRAIHQPGQSPASLHYSPTMHYEVETTHAPGVVAPALLTSEASALALPDVARLADVLPGLGLGRLAYGMLPGGKLMELPIAASYHALYHGDTRSGKTNAIDSVIVQLHHKQARMPLRLLLGDFKRELAATWGRSSLVESVEHDPAAIAATIQALVDGPDGITDRYALFTATSDETGRVVRNLGEYQTITGERLPLTFLILDELNAVLQACDKDERRDLVRALTSALQMGAGAGVFLLGGAQYLSADVFRREGSKQFVTRAHFGAYDPVVVGMLFGTKKLPDDVVGLLGERQGRGLIRTANQAQPQPFQSLLCEEADILDAIAVVNNGKRAGSAGESAEVQSDHAADTGQSGGNGKSTSATSYAVNGTSGTSVADDAEKYYAVKWLRLRGESMTAIIKQVWGVEGGRAYADARAEYERILRQLDNQERAA